MSGLSKDPTAQVLERRIEDVEKELVSVTSRAETERTCLFVLVTLLPTPFESLADARFLLVVATAGIDAEVAGESSLTRRRRFEALR